MLNDYRLSMLIARAIAVPSLITTGNYYGDHNGHWVEERLYDLNVLLRIIAGCLFPCVSIFSFISIW